MSHLRQPIISAVENVPCYYLRYLSTWIACKGTYKECISGFEKKFLVEITIAKI